MQEWDDSDLLQEYVQRGSEEAFAGPGQAAYQQSLFRGPAARAEPASGRRSHAGGVCHPGAQVARLAQTHLPFGLAVSNRPAYVGDFPEKRNPARPPRRGSPHANHLDQTESDAWRQIAPLLDGAIAGLGAPDREAIVLRFFDGKTMKEVGAALDASEDAAKKRVNRALEKLRVFFARRGIASTTALLALAISAHSVQAAPVGLAGTVCATAARLSGGRLNLSPGQRSIETYGLDKGEDRRRSRYRGAVGDRHGDRGHRARESAFRIRLVLAVRPAAYLVRRHAPPALHRRRQACGVCGPESR